MERGNLFQYHDCSIFPGLFVKILFECPLSEIQILHTVLWQVDSIHELPAQCG